MGVTFKQILSDPVIDERWNRVKQYFFLRESTYDMTCRCNLKCEGCYYYIGDKQYAKDEMDTGKWRALLTAEKERGITFVVLAGAEPSLVPELCKVCYDVIPLGAIASMILMLFTEREMMRRSFPDWQFFVGPTVLFLVGLWLLFGSQSLVNLLKRARNAGHMSSD